MLLSKEEVKYFFENKDQITYELLEALRKNGKPGKKQALEILDLPKDNDNYYLDAYDSRISYMGTRTLKKAFTKLKLSKIHIEEIERCINDIHYFLANYVRMTTPRGFDFVDSRPYQDEFLELLNKEEIDKIIVLMPRQSGKSVSTGIKLAHVITFDKDLTIGIVANRGDQAREFLDKTKKIIQGLPIWLQPSIVTWNKGSIECDNNVRILTDVPSQDSFRGYSCISADSVIKVQDAANIIQDITIKDLYNTHKQFNKFKVLTPNGFKVFNRVIKSKFNEGIKLSFENKEIKVTKTHLFRIFKGDNINCANPEAYIKENNNLYIEAKYLKVGDTIQNTKIIKIENILGEFYDFVDVDGHEYICNGLINHNCNYIVVDEAAFITQGFQDLKDSVFPTQAGLSRKKLILLSTANGKNHFYEIWKSAGDNKENSENGYVKYFVNWENVPRFKSDGTRYTSVEFKTEQIKANGLVYFNQNYGCSFIGSSETLIQGHILNGFQIKEPLDIDKIGNSLINVYEEPIPGHKYILSADTSKNGVDPTAFQIFDITDLHFKQVASAQLFINHMELPELFVDYAGRFNQALILIENNEGSGQSVADHIKWTYEYENLYYDVDKNGKRLKYPGCRTTKLTRLLMLGACQKFAEAGLLTLCDEKTIKEFETFTLNKDGKYEAQFGFHDDLVMSTCLAFSIFSNGKNFEDYKEILETIKTGESTYNGDYLTFGAFADGL